MNEMYAPLVKQGGLLGWGYMSHPVIPGMFSIDNGFLLIHLSYGDAGYFLFLLITAEAIRGLIARCWKFTQPIDQALAISLLAAMAVFFISITTAYMGEQTPQIAFLLMGWGQSLRQLAPAASLSREEISVSKFELKRVFS